MGFQNFVVSNKIHPFKKKNLLRVFTDFIFSIIIFVYAISIVSENIFNIIYIVFHYMKYSILVSSSRYFFNNFLIILFPQDMIQDIYKLHWNIIHKLTGVT